MYIESIDFVESEEDVYDEDGLYFDEDEQVWYCVDDEGTEYYYDEDADEWVECEYEEEVVWDDSDE
jgi:hypothetical protein